MLARWAENLRCFLNAWDAVASRDLTDHLHSFYFSVQSANLGLVAVNINMNQPCALSPNAERPGQTNVREK